MKRIFSFISLLFITLSVSYGQEEDIDELLPEPPVSYKLKLQRYRYVKPVIEGKDTMWCYLLPATSPRSKQSDRRNLPHARTTARQESKGSAHKKRGA